jgi:hypothetical protein
VEAEAAAETTGEGGDEVVDRVGDLFYCLFLKLNRTLISIVCFWETFFTATPK